MAKASTRPNDAKVASAAARVNPSTTTSVFAATENEVDATTTDSH